MVSRRSLRRCATSEARAMHVSGKLHHGCLRYTICRPAARRSNKLAPPRCTSKRSHELPNVEPPMNNADLIVATLKAAGIDRGFGIPSGNVLPLMEAMRKGGIDFVLTAHEGSAGFAADVTGPHDRRAGPVHRDARAGRHQSRDRRRLRLARPLADDRHHLQSQHRPARPAHPDVDRPPCAVRADHQGDAAAGERAASPRRCRRRSALR